MTIEAPAVPLRGAGALVAVASLALGAFFHRAVMGPMAFAAALVASGRPGALGIVTLPAGDWVQPRLVARIAVTVGTALVALGARRCCRGFAMAGCTGDCVDHVIVAWAIIAHTVVIGAAAVRGMAFDTAGLAGVKCRIAGGVIMAPRAPSSARAHGTTGMNGMAAQTLPPGA